MHLPKIWIDRRVYEYFATNLAPVLWSKKTPILVYQMGKVGSSSLRNSLFRCGAPETDLVLMSHELFPVRTRNLDSLVISENIRHWALEEIQHDRDLYKQFPLSRKLGWWFRETFYTKKIFKNYVHTRRPLNVITLVREPIANNISMFFQVLEHYTGKKYRQSDFSTDRLIQIFLKRYIHSRPLTWLEAELQPMLGIDVYQYIFPRETGYLSIQRENIRLLILKCELPDKAKESAIQSFLGVTDFSIVSSNLSSEKLYSEQYEEFKRRIVFPKAWLDEIYGSRYMRHFYSDREIAAFRSRWQKKPFGGVPC